MSSLGNITGWVLLLSLQAQSSTFLGGTVPDDPFFALQWGLENTGQEVQGEAGLPGADISAPEAWDVHSGTSSVVVAVVGTGVDPHPEFADRLLPGYATIGDPFDTSDPCSKGTHIAGIIAAAGGNGMGIAGLHSRARLLPVRAFTDCEEGDTASVAAGLQWAVDQGADIVVVAFAFINGNQRLADAVAYARAGDVLVIAPAGNDANNDVSFPAAYDGCLAVSATTQRDTLATFSNYGSAVSLSAPGENILSTWSGSGFEYQSSTATAAAFVAGTAALVMSYAPQLSTVEVVHVLLDSAQDLGDPGWDERFGAGRLNAWHALGLTPEPAIRFEHTEAFPTTLRPGAATSFTVRIADCAETVVEDSVALFHRTHTGPFTQASARLIGGGLYALDLPALSCDTAVEYYVSAMGDGQTPVRDPLDAPTSVYQARAVRMEPIFSDDFEMDQGWETLADGGETTTGHWERVNPVGTFAQEDIPVQPEYDYSPNTGRLCYVTGQHPGGNAGANDVDGGPVRLVSPVVSLDTPDAEIRYARWFHSSGGAPDELTVELSRDGGDTWFLIETVSTTDGWEEHSLRLSDFPKTAGNQIRVRFSTQDLFCEDMGTPCASLTEAAIDEFHIRAILCSSSKGDSDGNGRIDLSDFRDMAVCFTGPPAGSQVVSGECGLFDFDDDGGVDLRDCQVFQNWFAPGND